MDFSIPDSLRATLDRIDGFVVDAVLPVEPLLARPSFDAAEAALQPVRDRARAAGLWLPQIAASHGGMGLSLGEHALVSERLGRSPLGHYALNCQAPDAGNMEILIEFGSDAQRERWLAPLLRGEIRSCFAMTEPERPGSNPVWMDSRATPDGDGWVLDGHKWFTTAADGAAFAIVMAVTDADAPRHRRASMFVVPTDAPGFERVRNIPVMGHAGSGWLSHAEIRLTGCRVGAGALLGARGEGFAIAQSRLGPGRIHHCMRWIGVAQRCYEMMCARAASRDIAPGEKLGGKQTVQSWIAESRAEIAAARLLVLHAASRVEAVGARAARADISMIKFHVARVLLDAIDRAIQVHGALGVTDDTVLSFFYRNERGARIYDGPDEVHKSVVAREVLRDLDRAEPAR